MFTIAFSVLLPAGLILIFQGFRLQSRGVNAYGQRYAERAKRRWLKRLLSWGVIPDANQAALVLPDVVEHDASISSAATIGAGCGVIIGTLIYILFVITIPQISLLSYSFPGFFLVPETTCIALGYITGYTIGIQKQRVAAQRRSTYADLRQRKLTDYRYPLLPALAGVLVMINISLTGNVTAHLGPMFSVQDALGGVTTLPSIPWLLWIFPAGMITTLFICEGAMRQVVSLPRLLTTPDPQVSQRVDELLRARAIGKLQSTQLFYIGGLSLGQWLFLRYEFWSLGPFETYAVLILIIVIGIGGLFLDDFAGRIGGKITGWPWRKRVLV